MFHTANAWEDGDEVRLYGCCMNVVRAWQRPGHRHAHSLPGMKVRRGHTICYEVHSMPSLVNTAHCRCCAVDKVSDLGCGVAATSSAFAASGQSYRSRAAIAVDCC